MSERQEVEGVAGEIIAAVSREFPRLSIDLDFEAAKEDHEDAYLWITPGTDNREEITEIWGFVIQLVQEAYQERDVYLVARMRGVGTIQRDRPQDKE